MENYYSKINPEKLLHMVHRFSDSLGRVDLVPYDNFIQCAFLNLEKGNLGL
jgi:hypothetical protein